MVGDLERYPWYLLRLNRQYAILVLYVALLTACRREIPAMFTRCAEGPRSLVRDNRSLKKDRKGDQADKRATDLLNSRLCAHS